MSLQGFFLQLLAICFSYLLLGSSCQSRNDAQSTAEQPNFVIIMADDMGYGDLGCYGSEVNPTPHIDALARGGMHFTDYHSNGPVCTPTRAALMSGRYQQRAGLEGVLYASGEKTAWHREEGGLALEYVTLAEAIRDLGYETAMYGKWHLGYHPRFNPVNQGFDEFAGFVSGNVDYQSHVDGGGYLDWWKDSLIQDEPGYTTYLITRHAVDFIRKERDTPFLLYLAHEAPHYPYQGPSDPAFRTVGMKTVQGHGPREDREQAYTEMITALDEGVGDVMKALDVEGLTRSTLIFFCSDNGATALGSNGHFSGTKGTLLEGGHRVPAIASWPGPIETGSRSDETILSMDLYPTLLELAGGQVDQAGDALDGLSFAGVLLRNQIMPERVLFWKFRNWQAARKGDWKLLVKGDEKMLFNLGNDPGETINLVSEESVLASQLDSLLNEWRNEINRPQF